MDKKNFTINYASEGYKARLLTAQEVAYITGNDSWNERTADVHSNFYFGSLDSSTIYSSQTAEVKAKQESLGWLFANLYSCGSNGCGASNNSTVSSGNKAYWTSSPLAGSDNSVWYVEPLGRLTTNFGFTSNTNFGIRPVITVSTSEVFS